MAQCSQKLIKRIYNIFQEERIMSNERTGRTAYQLYGKFRRSYMQKYYQMMSSQSSDELSRQRGQSIIQNNL